jgi:hypothetical protein
MRAPLLFDRKNWLQKSLSRVMYIPAKRDTIGPSSRCDKDKIMDTTYQDNSEHSRRRPNAAITEAGSAHDTDTAVAYAGQAGSLLRSPGIGASHNAPVRAEAMQQMQGTHGNRAVQRTVSMNGSAERIALQRNVPPAPPMQEEEMSIWDRYDRVKDTVNTGNNVVDVATSGMGMLGDISMWGHVAPTVSPVADWVATRPGGSWLASQFADFTRVGKGMEMVGKGSDALGMAMGLYDLATAKDNYGRVQAGADTAASAAGLFGGPIGGAFSFGYSAGQLLDKTFGLSDKLSDVLVDLDPLGLQGPSIEEMSDEELASLEEMNPLMRGAVRKERSDRGAIAIRMRNRHRDAMDAQRQKEFEKEMERLSAQIERGPAIPSTMMGGPGDTLSGRNMYGQQPQIDEDGEPVPYVPMALPGR